MKVITAIIKRPIKKGLIFVGTSEFSSINIAEKKPNGPAISKKGPSTLKKSSATSSRSLISPRRPYCSLALKLVQLLV